MADYLVILDSETNPNAPLRSSLFKRMVANPIAIAEGAAGAPKVMGVALRLMVPLVQTTASNWGEWTGLDRASWVEIFCTHTSANGQSIQLRLSSDGGSTWSAASSLLVLSAGGALDSAIIQVNISTGEWRAFRLNVSLFTTGTLALSGAPNALGIRAAGTNGTINATAKIIGGVSP